MKTAKRIRACALLMSLAFALFGFAEGKAAPMGQEFVFSRNGLTWNSTWKQVLEAESSAEYTYEYRKKEYPGFKNLEVSSPTVAGFEVHGINYLFYNELFLAIFYDLNSFSIRPAGESYSSGHRMQSESYKETIQSAMTSKYGQPLPSGRDWLSQRLNLIPESLWSYFHAEYSHHVAWKVSSDTLAFLVHFKEYDSRTGVSALIYLNPERIDRLGFDILPGIDTEGL